MDKTTQIHNTSATGTGGLENKRWESKSDRPTGPNGTRQHGGVEASPVKERKIKTNS